MTDDPDHAPPRPLFRTRTDALFASAASRAVILRRGPKRHFRLVVWNLADDSFEPGQWMKGMISLSDLSPDGGLLLYRAAQYHPSATWRPFHGATGGFDPIRGRPSRATPRRGRAHRRIPRYLGGGASAGTGPPRENKGTWTAISRPPWFSALAIWPSHGRWTGGGFFRGAGDLVLYESEDGMAPVATVPMPASIRIKRYERDDPCVTAAHVPTWGPHDAAMREVWQGLLAAGARNLDWLTTFRAPDLLFAADGVIYRLPGWREVAPAHWLAAARPLIDLAPMAFEPIAPPPDAMCW